MSTIVHLLSGAFTAAVTASLFRSFLTISDLSIFHLPFFFGIFAIETASGFHIYRNLNSSSQKRMHTVQYSLIVLSGYVPFAVSFILGSRMLLGLGRFEMLPWYALTAYPAAVMLPIAVPAGILLKDSISRSIPKSLLLGFALYLTADTFFFWKTDLITIALFSAAAGLLITVSQAEKVLYKIFLVFFAAFIAVSAFRGLHQPFIDLIRSSSRDAAESIEGALTPYGEHGVYDTNGRRTIALNSSRIINTDDTGRIQETVHMTLLQHIMARKILIIGEWPEAVSEALRYPNVQTIHWAGATPETTGSLRRHLPEDNRIRLISTSDPRLFIRRIGYGSAFDVVIISLPDPVSLFLNRYYTYEFFREIRSVLSPNAIVAFTLEYSQENPDRNKKLLIHSVMNSMKRVFPNTLVMTRGHPLILASSERNFTTSWPALSEFIKALDGRPSHISPVLLRFKLDTAISWDDEISGTRLNLDSRPAPLKYAFNELLFSFGIVSESVIDFTERVSSLMIHSVFLLLAAAAAFFLSKKTGSLKIRIFGSLAAMTLIIFIYSMMIAFQSYNGQVLRFFPALLGSIAAGALLSGMILERREAFSAGLRARAMLLLTALFMLITPSFFELSFSPLHPLFIVLLSFICGILAGGALHELSRALSYETGSDEIEFTFIFPGIVVAAATSVLLLPVTGIIDIMTVLGIICLTGVFLVNV